MNNLIIDQIIKYLEENDIHEYSFDDSYGWSTFVFNIAEFKIRIPITTGLTLDDFVFQVNLNIIESLKAQYNYHTSVAYSLNTRISDLMKNPRFVINKNQPIS